MEKRDLYLLYNLTQALWLQYEIYGLIPGNARSSSYLLKSKPGHIEILWFN